MFFRKRIMAFTIVIVISMGMFTSCFFKEGFNLDNMKFNESINIFDIVTTIYDESQIKNICTMNCTINELNKCFPIECIRKENNNYRVSYAGKNKFVVILFDENGKWILAKTYQAYLSLSDYKTIKKGQSLDEVMKIDPYGEYLFLYTGRNDFPRTSRHLSKDGYLITIKYISNIVDEIQIDLI